MQWQPTLLATACLLALLVTSQPVSAFCGFYVAKADTDLFNDASKVVIARDGERTVVTMASDFRGDVSEFAMVIPVVDIPEREQINVANPGLIEHLDAYTAPRLVEYHDENPCIENRIEEVVVTGQRATIRQKARQDIAAPEQLGVVIEATYEVGEYDILILSAKQSDGLIQWLNQEGYNIPDGAEQTVSAYLKRDMKFFVAKVSLDRHDGKANLRPIQVAYEDEDYMLPIRLGTVNAQGKQELFVFALSRKGRVETTNYRTVKLPSDMDVPVYLKEEFGDFYKDMFRHQVKRENGKAVFMEYAWDMSWCDPCAAQPLSRSELRELGVMWLDGSNLTRREQRKLRRNPRPVDVFVTRLHLRYDAESFPEDLKFQATGDRTNYQGRYVLRHAWRGDFEQCEAARTYANGLVDRWDEEAQTLARLTGRDVNDIRARMAEEGLSATSLGLKNVEPGVQQNWWQRLWGRKG